MVNIYFQLKKDAKQSVLLSCYHGRGRGSSLFLYIQIYIYKNKASLQGHPRIWQKIWPPPGGDMDGYGQKDFLFPTELLSLLNFVPFT